MNSLAVLIYRWGAAIIVNQLISYVYRNERRFVYVYKMQIVN